MDLFEHEFLEVEPAKLKETVHYWVNQREFKLVSVVPFTKIIVELFQDDVGLWPIDTPTEMMFVSLVRRF